MKQLLATIVLSAALTGGAITAHAEGDPAEGEDVFNKSGCKTCHTVDEGGKDRAGPNLWGVFGATAGQRVASFEKRHSPALKESGIVWDEENLHKYLEDPKGFIPKNRMNFRGIKDAEEREDLIAYLKTLQ